MTFNNFSQSFLFGIQSLWIFKQLMLIQLKQGSDFVTKSYGYSLGTHLVKNHESESTTNESQFKKTKSLKLKMLGPLCNQTVNLKTDSKTLYYSLLILKYSP